MEQHTNSVDLPNGAALKGATITVSDANGLASIFSDDGVTAKANPFTSDARTGNFQFYAANGEYTVTVSKAGIETITYTVTLYDPANDTLRADAQAAQAAAEAAKVGAEAAQAAAETAQDGAETAQAGAETAQTAAELAHQNALIGAGSYVDEPTGRAAVANGVAFKVQGSGDVAAYEYRRVDASTSTLIATYPSSSAVTGLGADLIAGVAEEVFIGNATGGAVNGYNGGTVVLFTPAAAKSVVKSISLYANATGSLTIKKFSRVSNTFTLVSTLGVLTIPSTGVHTFGPATFGDLTLEADQYLGFSTPTNNLLVYSGTSSNQHFYNSSATTTSYTATAAIYNLQLNATLQSLPSQLGQQFSEYVAQTDAALLNLEIAAAQTAGIVDLHGRVYAGGSGSSFNAGTTIIPQPVEGARILAGISLFANVAGVLTLKKFTLSGTTFTLAETLGTITVSGAGEHDYDTTDFGRIEFAANEYIGFSTPTANVITYNGSATETYYFNSSATTTSFTKPTAGTVIPQINFSMVALETPPSEVNRWQDETLVTFGDSITWYDGQAFRDSHIEAGQTAVGYQSHVADALGCVINNQGRSGYTMPEIWTSVVSSFDFSTAYAATFTGGANDHRTNVSPGAVAAVGGTFNTATYAGALQSCIEAAYESNPDIKLYLITPIKGWFFESGTTNVPGPYNGEMVISDDYVAIIRQLGELYSIPVLDWYNASGINAMNYRLPGSTTANYIGDNTAVFTSYALHPTQKGFARMAESLIPFLRDN